VHRFSSFVLCEPGLMQFQVLPDLAVSPHVPVALGVTSPGRARRTGRWRSPAGRPPGQAQAAAEAGGRELAVAIAGHDHGRECLAADPAAARRHPASELVGQVARQVDAARVDEQFPWPLGAEAS
jgi:hypothetical protein